MSMLASASFCGSTFSPPPKEARKWPWRPWPRPVSEAGFRGWICVPLCRDLAQRDNDNDNSNDNNNNNNNVLMLLLSLLSLLRLLLFRRRRRRHLARDAA